MRKKIILLYLLRLLINFATNAQWTSNNSASLSSGKSPDLKWDKTEFNFGTIKNGSSGKVIFKMTNTGGVPIIITKAEGTCGCTDITYPKQPILPGKTVDVVVKYEAEEKGTFNKTVTLGLSIEKKDPVLHIRGQVE